MGKEINLGIFASDNIQSATLSLLADLGIDMEVRSQQQIPIPAVVAASLGQTPKAVQEICDKIAESYLAGIISDNTFTGEGGAASFEEACQNVGRYEQMMVFAVDFIKSEKITRTEMATLTRALNRASKASPVVLVCRYADEEGIRFALSLCERTAYKQAGHTGEKAGKVNILRGINPENPHTGHVRILEDMRLERKDNTFEAVYNKWFGVFDNDVLTNQFYKELQDWFFWAIKHVQFPNDIDDDTDDQKYNPQNVIRLITRLIFVWFLRQKGLVPKELFNREDLDHLVKDFEPDNFESSTYYRVILQNLFFATLNKKIEDRAFISDNFIENRNLGKHKIKTFMRHASDLAVSKQEFINLVRPVPFMNNSLFECLDNKEQNGRTYNWDGFSDSNKPQRQAFVPNYLFFAKEEYVDLSKEYDRASASSTKVFGLLNILKRYNFTVEENTPLDQDVALDPELLGKVFENLLAAYNPETEQTVRKSTGSYYTPRPIVQYMVDESLVTYLKKAVPDVEDDTLRSLLSYSDDDQGSTLNEKQTRDIVEAILNCKVLDPACGSGAFPMGMLQQMSHLLSRVDASNKYWEEVVINRALNDEAFVDKMNDEEKEAHKNEIEEVFKLSVNYPDYARKLYLIENCIYGVDLQSIAVQISRLRFFISLLCEQQPSDDANKNYNIKPLPNLEMKFVSANSLVRLEHIDEARELFANKDILDLIAQLKGVRHELFVVTDHHVKEKLLTRDETLRHQIMLSTGDCYVKGTEDKIKEYEETLARLEKELAVAEHQPDEIVHQSVQYDLFGENKEIITVNRKEIKIKEISGQIRYFKRESKRLTETLTSGRDKAMRLAKQLTDWNPYDQNVSSPFFDPEWMFGIINGFDVVIGNPPYVQLQNNKGAVGKLYQDKGFSSFFKMGDLYCLFIEKGYQLLKEDGILSYINPNTWLQSISFAPIRKFITTNMAWHQVLVTPKVFDATVDTHCLLLRRSNNYCDCDVYEMNKDKVVSLLHSLPKEYFVKRENAINIVSSPKITLLASRLIENNNTVADYCRVVNGVKPFSKGRGTPVQTAEIVRTHPYVKEGEKPADNWSPLMRGSLMHRYENRWNNNYWILYGPNLAEPRDPTVFEAPHKIIVRQTGDSIIATTITGGIICRDNLHVCVPLDSNTSLNFILGVMNSKLTDFIYSYINPEKGEALAQVKKAYVEQLPIPVINTPQKEEWEKQIMALVETILSKKMSNLTTDTEESKIDNFVYHLFDLSYDEVIIVDPETTITEDLYNSL